MDGSFEIREFLEGRRSPFSDWFNRLDAVTAERVDRYVRRLEAGNFGNTKPLRDGVFELRMDFGPGYRVYFGRERRTIIILVGGGSKRGQAADTAIAVERWRRYQQLRT